MVMDGTKIAVLGFGEIGSSFARVFASSGAGVAVAARDPFKCKNDDLGGASALHVCIPCQHANPEAFIAAVRSAVDDSGAPLVVVHSTVSPGMTKRLAAEVGGGGVLFAHAPVRGVHPNLDDGIRQFVTYVGGATPEAGAAAEAHLLRMGLVRVKQMSDSTHTEVAKLMSTTYYGVCLGFHAEMQQLCAEIGVGYDEVLVDWTRTYNEGFAQEPFATLRPEVTRPIFPQLKLPIGGHCVGPNAKLLREAWDATERGACLSTDLVRKFCAHDN